MRVGATLHIMGVGGKRDSSQVPQANVHFLCLLVNLRKTEVMLLTVSLFSTLTLRSVDFVPGWVLFTWYFWILFPLLKQNIVLSSKLPCCLFLHSTGLGISSGRNQAIVQWQNESEALYLLNCERKYLWALALLIYGLYAWPSNGSNEYHFFSW